VQYKSDKAHAFKEK
jgi:hypothetical protein